jgi:exopolysaccharide production protein ExoQ
MSDFIFPAIGGIFALLAAVGVTLATSFSLHVRTRYEKLALPLLVTLLILNMAIQPVLTGRDLRFVFSGTDYLPTGFQSVVFALFGKGLLYFTMLVASIEVAHQILRRRIQGRQSSGALLLTLLIYFFAAFILAGLLGATKGLAHFYFYLPILFGAIYFSSGSDPAKVARCFRNAIAVVLVATLLTLLIAPDMVLQKNFRSSIPLYDSRLWGLSAHPNAFAPISLAFLILLRYQSFKSSAINWTAWLLGAGAVVAAQSKTVWAVALMLLAAHLLWRVWGEIRRAKTTLMSTTILAGFLIATTAGSVLVLAWSFGLVRLNLEQMLRLDVNALSTLSGRDVIWDLSLEEWRRSPIFGYGLNLWGDEYRRQMSLPSAFHAHNQFIQTLAASGVVGLAGLLLYMGVLTAYVLKVGPSLRPYALALLAILFIRCFSEPPFELRSVSDANVLIHLCLFGMIAAARRAEAPPEAGSHAR